VAVEFFIEKTVVLSDCIKFAQIACKLGANIGEAFCFATKDERLRSTKHVVLHDADGTLEALFPESWCSEHLLHQDYLKSFDSCSREEWLRWISSGRAGLRSFVPLVERTSHFWDRQRVYDELNRRGYSKHVWFPYTYDKFELDDWDYDKTFWDHWIGLAKDDPNLWGRIAEIILAQPNAYWSKAKSAEMNQIASNGRMSEMTDDTLRPSWIMKLRDLRCLPDTRGFLHKPGDLLRRTPETESLLDVELFVHGRLDTEATRPLLKLLGVCDTPAGPDRLLDRLRALSKAEKPPIHEVDKWYRRLDQMVHTCSTNDFARIKEAFSEEKLILTEDSGWANTSGVFVTSNEEDVPGAAVIRVSVNDLSIWRKIGVAERPTADLAIQWLKGLPSGKTLSQDDIRRVKALLQRHPERIWNECSHWLNLAGEWVPTTTLGFALSMHTLVPWRHLDPSVKQKTADFQGLPREIAEVSPFSLLPPLASVIEDRFHDGSPFSLHSERKAWLNVLGEVLCRIELDDAAETGRIRDLAAKLANTEWQTVAGLETIPYIDGKPVGTPRRAEVVWLKNVLYVDQLSNAKLARLVPDKLGKIFIRPDIAAALNYCFDRPSEQITEYLEENFNLQPRDTTYPIPIEGKGPEVEPSDTGEDEPPGPPPVRPPFTPIINGPVENPPPGLESGYKTPPREPHPPKPPKPSIIERFAESLGFRKDGDEKFSHADRSLIAKTHDKGFPWVRLNAAGEVVCYYWPKDHCLEQEPLQVDYDIWGLIDGYPETHAFVLSNQQGDPVEVRGEHLRSMRAEGLITLYPATYRLVYNNDK